MSVVLSHIINQQYGCHMYGCHRHSCQGKVNSQHGHHLEKQKVEIFL
jgi:hypothetical protein